MQVGAREDVMAEEEEKLKNALKAIKIKAAGRRADVYLISGTKVMEATVSASVDNFTTFTRVRFDRLDPVRMVISSNIMSIKADGNDNPNSAKK